MIMRLYYEAPESTEAKLCRLGEQDAAYVRNSDGGGSITRAMS